MGIDSLAVVTLALIAGVSAGALTSAAGFGGGVLLTVLLSIAIGPEQALAVCAPALLIGHIHRAIELRRDVERDQAGTFALAAVPGTALGAATLAVMPPVAVWVVVLVAMAAGVVTIVGRAPPAVGRRAWMPGAALVGWLAGSAGMGGILLPPLMLGGGLRGSRLVATAAVCSASVSVTRVVSYGAAGLFAGEQLPAMVAVTVGIVSGNACGIRVLVRMTPGRQRGMVAMTFGLCIAAAVHGRVAA